MNHHIEHLGRKALRRVQGFESIFRMLAHEGHLVFIQAAGLLENGERNARLANIVQHAGE